MKTVSRFSRQNDLGLRAQCWENLVLVLESKALYNLVKDLKFKHSFTGNGNELERVLKYPQRCFMQPA